MGRWFQGQEREGIIELIERYLHDVSVFEQKMKEIFADTDPDFDELDTGGNGWHCHSYSKFNPRTTP